MPAPVVDPVPLNGTAVTAQVSRVGEAAAAVGRLVLATTVVVAVREQPLVLFVTVTV